MHNVAIIRIEQLYPFPEDELTADIGALYLSAKNCLVSRRTKNQGAWYCYSTSFT